MCHFFCSVIILLTIIYNLHNNKLDSIKTIFPFRLKVIIWHPVVSPQHSPLFRKKYFTLVEQFEVSWCDLVIISTNWICGDMCSAFILKCLCKVFFVVFTKKKKVKLFYQSEVSFCVVLPSWCGNVSSSVEFPSLSDYRDIKGNIWLNSKYFDSYVEEDSPAGLKKLESWWSRRVRTFRL